MTLHGVTKACCGGIRGKSTICYKETQYWGMHRQSETRAGNHRTLTRTLEHSLEAQMKAQNQAATAGSAKRHAPRCALQCLDVFLGAGELPRRLVFRLCVRWGGTCCALGGCRAGLRLLH